MTWVERRPIARAIERVICEFAMYRADEWRDTVLPWDQPGIWFRDLLEEIAARYYGPAVVAKMRQRLVNAFFLWRRGLRYDHC